MTRYWASWYGGDDGDPRPVVYPVPIEWWCSGEDLDGLCTICAIVEADDEVDVMRVARQWWPEATPRFCKEVAADWRPNADRFPSSNRDAKGGG